MRAMHARATLVFLLVNSITSENVAERFGVSRQDQDDFALSSQIK